MSNNYNESHMSDSLDKVYGIRLSEYFGYQGDYSWCECVLVNY